MNANLLEQVRRQYGETTTPGYLRIEVALNNSKTSYNFDILNGGGTVALPITTELLLNKSDIFVAGAMGFFAALQTVASPGLTKLQTYPNTSGFYPVGSTSIQTGLTIRHLEAVYNGNISIKEGVTTYVDNMDLQRFRYVPQTQSDTINNTLPATYNWANLNSVTSYGPGENQRTFTDSFMGINPIKFSGAKKFSINVNLGTVASPAWQGTTVTTTQTIMVLYFRGFFAQGAAVNE